MRLALKLHPMSHTAAIDAIEAQVERRAGGLTVQFQARGRMDDVIIPDRAAPGRTDELWRQTCFEVFADGPGAGYREFNFSPSTQWAAYVFDGYREGMRALEVRAPRIRTQTSADALILTADFDLEGATRLGLSAVIQAVDGAAYWALAHGPGKPDFHAPDCFALQLPASQRP